MAIGVEIDRPSLANQARGMKTLQGLRGRIAYLAYNENREYARLLDMDGTEISQEEALALLGGEDRPYQEVVFAFSATDLQALQERSPYLDREECLMQFGKHLSRAHGKGRQVLAALHVQEDGSAHYHMETIDPYLKFGRDGQPAMDHDGKQKLEKMEGIGAHLDLAFQEAWAKTLPVKKRLRGEELEQLRERQAVAVAAQKAVAEERRQVKAEMDAELRPLTDKLTALRATKGAWKDEAEANLAVAEIKAKYGDRFRDSWRREAEVELERDLLWLEGRGHSRDSLEAECKRERAEIRLTTRLNRVDRDEDKYRTLDLLKDRYADREKGMTSEQKEAARKEYFEREVALIHQRFAAQRSAVLAEQETYSAHHLKDTMEVLLTREEAAIQAAALGMEAGASRDRQDDLRDQFQGREGREALKAEQAEALKGAKLHSETLPQDERDRFLREERSRIHREFGERRMSFAKDSWDDRKAAHEQAVEVLHARHLNEIEAERLDALARGRDVNEAQVERLEKRHLKDTARLESDWVQEQAKMLRLDENEVYSRVVGTEALDDLRTRREAALEAARTKAEALSEEERERALAKEQRGIRREFELEERELYRDLPELDELRSAVENRVALEAEAARLQAFSRGMEWDAQAFDEKADRSALLRAEARREMWGLRIAEAEQMEVAKDLAWQEGREARREAQDQRIEEAKNQSRQGWERLREAVLVSPEVVERLDGRMEREVEAAERRASRQERITALKEERTHLLDTADERRAALTNALEIQAKRHALDLQIREGQANRTAAVLEQKIEKPQKREGKNAEIEALKERLAEAQWSPEKQERVEAEHDLETRRTYAAWFAQEARLMRVEHDLALLEATQQEGATLREAHLADERAALYEAAALRLAVLPDVPERELAVRELRAQERQMEARAAREGRESRAEEKPDWEALGQSLGQAQGYEIQAAADQARDPESEYERLSEIRKRHADQLKGLTAARLRYDSQLARDRSDMALEPGREAQRAREARILAEERAILARGLPQRETEAALREARKAGREDEWSELKETRQSRLEAFAAGMAALVEAQELEQRALKVGPQFEGQEPLEKRLADQEVRHEIQQNSMQIEMLREEERLGQRTLEFGSLRERAGAYRMIQESMQARHGLEFASLEHRLDLQGLAKDAPEREQPRRELADRHQADRDRLQKSVGRLQKEPKRAVRVGGKQAMMSILRNAMDKLREHHDKATQAKGGSGKEVDKVSGGLTSAVVTVIQTAAKNALSVGQEAARQVALQTQNAVRAAVHGAKSLAIGVVNPLAGAKALGQGLGEVGKDATKDLAKGATSTAKTVGRDTLQGAKDSTKQALGGLVDLSIPGGAEGKAIFQMAKQAAQTAKAVAMQAVAAVRSAVTLDLIGLGRAGLGAGTAVARGGVGVAKEAGIGIAKKLPTPIDKGLSMLAAVPILGIGVKAVQLGAEITHGAAELDR